MRKPARERAEEGSYLSSKPQIPAKSSSTKQSNLSKIVGWMIRLLNLSKVVGRMIRLWDWEPLRYQPMRLTTFSCGNLRLVQNRALWCIAIEQSRCVLFVRYIATPIPDWWLNLPQTWWCIIALSKLFSDACVNCVTVFKAKHFYELLGKMWLGQFECSIGAMVFNFYSKVIC